MTAATTDDRPQPKTEEPKTEEAKAEHAKGEHARAEQTNAEQQAPSEQAKRDDKEQRKPAPPSRKLLWLVLLGVVVALAIGAVGHWRTYAAAKETQDDISNDVPSVRTAPVKLLSDPIKITLPGQTQGFDQANIFARATGYIAQRSVDIGSMVKQGDLLAKIASPDLDRQLDQAEAARRQAGTAHGRARAIGEQQAMPRYRLASGDDGQRQRPAVGRPVHHGEAEHGRVVPGR